MAEKIKYMGVSSTQELINLLKADFAKKQDIIQFTELPPPEQAVGRCYEYVGETTMQFTNGHIYHSDGFVWEEVYKGLDGKTWQIVNTLPSFADASYDILYFVYEDGRLTGYVKGVDKMETVTSDKTWEVVTALPAWSAAESDTLYLVTDGTDKLKLYVKNPDEADTWYELGGGKTNFNELENIPTVNGIPLQNTAEPDEAKEVVIQSTIHKHDDDSAYDEDALLVDHDVPVHELELTALANAEIDLMFED